MIGVSLAIRSLASGAMGRLRGFGSTTQSNPAASVATSISISPASTSFALGKTQQYTATIRDQYGQSMAGTASWSSNSGNVTINSAGLATGAAYGSATITATFGALSNTAVATVQQPTKLAMNTQPSGAVSGSAFTVQPIVELQDASSNQDAESGRTVTVSVSAGTATLSGTTSATTDGNGRAVYTNLTLTGSGSCTLTFASTGLTGVSSASFNIGAVGAGTDDGFFIHTHEPVDANTLLAEDFSGGFGRRSLGSWYSKNCDQANASGGLQQDNVCGWCGTIFSDARLAERPRGVINLTGNTFVGATGSMDGTSNGNMADHTLKEAVDELWVRYYTKPNPTTQANYVFGAEKTLTFNKGEAGKGGIDFGDWSFNCAGNQDPDGATGCTMGFPWLAIAPQEDVCNYQNFDITSGHWWFIELHMKLNTVAGTANGEFHCWANDCGTGVLPVNPAGSPTLRFTRTNVNYNRLSSTDPAELIHTLWWEAWSNPSTIGERYIGWIKASKVGPIGYWPLAF